VLPRPWWLSFLCGSRNLRWLPVALIESADQIEPIAVARVAGLERLYLLALGVEPDYPTVRELREVSAV
jgi:hypothetical protein